MRLIVYSMTSLLLDGTYCEQDWIGFNGLCYAFTTEQGDFQEQEHKCAEMDANLVTITDSHHSSYVDKWTTDFLTLIFPSMFPLLKV